MTPEPLVVVVGAGPAGLAAGWSLRQAGVPFRIVERGQSVAASWRGFYDSLRLHTGKHLSSLPGLPFARATPLFPTRAQFIDYLEAYVRRFELPVEADNEVSEARWQEGAWNLGTTRGSCRASAVVLATGLAGNPHRPTWPGMADFAGQIIHSVHYRNPSLWKGKRVLVVGAGNSGAEIATELAAAGIPVSISIRSGAHVMPLMMLGLPVQYWALLLERLPGPLRELLAGCGGAISRVRQGPPVAPVPPWGRLERPPIIGFGLPRAIRQGTVKLRPGIASFAGNEARFDDGQREAVDAVILATGFRASVGFIRDSFATDERGFPRTHGIRCVDLPDCWVLGHRYATVGALTNIRRDAMTLVGEIRSWHSGVRPQP